LDDRKDTCPVKKLEPLIPKGFVPEQMAEENMGEPANPGSPE